MRVHRKWLLLAELAARLLLLAAVSLLLRPASGGSTELDEPTIMSRLRQFARDSGMVRPGMHWGGWDPADRTHPCHWHHVECDADQHVTEISLSNDINYLGGQQASHLRDARVPLARPVALPPELAQLQHLRELAVVVNGYMEAIPPEWAQPGAFPSLTRLFLEALGFTAPDPLPPVEAGALPALQVLELQAAQQEAPLRLPSSWGQPGVLPALQALTIQAPVALPLPASWSQGFPRLTKLVLAAPDPSSTDGAEPGSAAAEAAATVPPTDEAAGRLPDSWARGFPSLQILALNGLGLTGGFPAAWEGQGSFPSMRDMSLRKNSLTGPLPARVACNLPRLVSLELTENQFTGTLPPEWGLCQTPLMGISLAHNQLVGPAFPDTWVAPNTSLSVWYLVVDDNRGLNGTLPARLPWVNLKILNLRGTNVSRSVPEQWCSAPFAADLRQLILTDSQVNATLPPCAARAMPKLTYPESQAPPVEGAKGSQAAGAAMAGTSSTSGAAKLLLLAVAAGMVAAAVAAVRRWQPWKQHKFGGGLLSLPSLLLRRRQQQKGPQQDDAAVELLVVASDAPPDQLRRRQPHASELVPGRARMKALVQRQMGGSALSGRREKRLLSMGTLPQALAHELNSGKRPNGAGKLASIRGGGSGDSQGSATSSGSEPIVVRRWGLETDSLRMSVSDLQFIAEPDGSLVQLGEGAHGVVYLAKWQELYVAAKVFELHPGMHSQAFWHEISLLARCMHPRIVPVYGVAIQGQLLMVAVELMLGGSLRAALLDPERQHELRWDARGRQVALDVAEALVYLHADAQILHSDVKSANVLLSQEWRAALSDFGVAQVLAHSARTAAGGSSLYAAPEQLLGRRCTLAADVYSMGLLLVELFTRRVIVRRGDWEPPRPGVDCPREVADLIERCLSSEPLHRPSATEVLRCLRESSCSGSGSELY